MALRIWATFWGEKDLCEYVHQVLSMLLTMARESSFFFLASLLTFFFFFFSLPPFACSCLPEPLIQGQASIIISQDWFGMPVSTSPFTNTVPRRIMCLL